MDTAASAVFPPDNPAKPLAIVPRKPNSGRFQKGNMVAKKSGLQAKSERGSGYLQKRVGHALNRKLREAAAVGRPVDVLQVPAVRRLCQDLELRERAYREIMVELAQGKKFGDISEKTLDYFVRFGNAAQREEMSLGWSSVARGALLRDLSSAARDRAAVQAQQELQQRYGRKLAP